MCVIIYKPKNKKISDILDLKACFDYNPDGAGFMYNDGKKVHIKKGFMTFKALENALKKVPNDCDCVIHCRIGTAGSNSPQNTHPYSLYTGIERMQALENVCDYALCHNGILHDYNPLKNNKYDLNDTQLFILRVINSINKKYLFLDNTIEYIERMIESNKLALMDKNCVKLVGKWQKKDGIFYSNLNHENYYSYDYNYYYDDLFLDTIERYNCDGDCFNCTRFNCEFNESYCEYMKIFGGGKTC